MSLIESPAETASQSAAEADPSGGAADAGASKPKQNDSKGD